MSFDFDPNNNNNRAEADNDPEDVESYLGGEGLYGKFQAVPKLEPPIDPKANPLVIKACPLG